MSATLRNCCARAAPIARSTRLNRQCAGKLSRSSAAFTAPPDFLLPSFYSTSRPVERLLLAGSLRRGSLQKQNRSFSSCARRQDVLVTNPRQDEEGQDMIVDITPRASKRLKEIMSADADSSLALRVTVQSGGCHGFQYLMSLESLGANTTPPAASSPSSSSPSAPKTSEEEEFDDDEGDTIFEAGDGTGARVIMDEPSLALLKGSKVDYTQELIGSQFKIVGNPAATSSCGCGTSFDIKM